MLTLIAKCYDAGGFCVYEQAFERRHESDYNFTYAIQMMRLNPQIKKIVLTLTWKD